MHRILFEIGPLTFYSYGFFVAVGFLLAAFLSVREARRSGVPENDMMDILLSVLAGGLLGGRLLFVLLNREMFMAEPLSIIMLQEGGLAFHGALAGGAAAGILAVRVKRIPVLKMADLIAPYIALGHSIGRIGCYFNGCCYGRVIESGPGVTFPGETFMRIPVQLYSSLALLFIFIILIYLRRLRGIPRGGVFAAYLLIYGFFRFFVEFLRADNPAVYAGLTLSQLISAGMLLVGVLMLAVLFLSARPGRHAE
ncbi:MAG: prolipoprotein diacylglyceryl transferase [Candidatus Omnitrophica bacterium]|nr:prolipoprotein diacylglyceryl transferase [Candidatus Omnitrophota bacterium]